MKLSLFEDIILCPDIIRAINVHKSCHNLNIFFLEDTTIHIEWDILLGRQFMNAVNTVGC